MVLNDHSRCDAYIFFGAAVRTIKKSVRKRIKRERLFQLTITLQIDFLLLLSNEKSRKRRKPKAVLSQLI
jgi:hypothetical protein